MGDSWKDMEKTWQNSGAGHQFSGPTAGYVQVAQAQAGAQIGNAGQQHQHHEPQRQQYQQHGGGVQGNIHANHQGIRSQQAGGNEQNHQVGVMVAKSAVEIANDMSTLLQLWVEFFL